MTSFQQPYPLKEIKLEVTRRCPLNCIHCSSDAGPTAPVEVTEAACLNVLQQAASMGVEEFSFSGGEPLIWPGLVKAVDVAARLGMKVSLYSSGNPENGLELWPQLKTAGLTRVVFSLFGRAQTHERITRIAGSYDITWRAILKTISLGLEVEAHFVPLVENYKELFDVAHDAKKQGIRRISILRFVPQGRGGLIKTFELDRGKHFELKRTIEELRRQGHDIRTGSPLSFLSIDEKPQCMSGKDRLIIDPELRLYPCDAFKRIQAEEVVGTLDYSTLQQFSLADCWYKSPYLNAVRSQLEEPKAEPCQSCSSVERCGSGCLAQKVIANGKLGSGPDPSCLLGNGAIK
ncbi:radical SAM protein [Heliobacterium undosum]|uniref:Radical SAM protein n=1 Tax=Heliomicrobium undosum TaxID=121734 RepID=A0A845L9J9_9FIRM|nr:radical SAM protein [Heliomicrobium undosum]MZP31300.1 radical SAM protein [Heliomicrobium undosum]